MVRIIAGEVVQDDDPRLAQQSRVSSQPGPSTGPPTAAAAAAGWLAGFSSGFDWDAPPFKLVPRPDAPVSIPDVEVFGLPVPGPGLLAVVAVGVFFGFRACLAAAALGYVYLRTSAATGTEAAAATGPRAGRPTRAGGGFVMQQQQEQQRQGGFGSPLGQPRGQGSGTQSSAAFQGKAYKLRDS